MTQTSNTVPAASSAQLPADATDDDWVRAALADPRVQAALAEYQKIMRLLAPRKPKGGALFQNQGGQSHD
jgi:hypothetical protein